MNLVVVARQPEVGERTRRDHLPAHRPPPVADARRPVRGSRRPAVARRAHPGPLRAPARRRARDVLRADLPDRRRRDRPAPVRARRPAADPRPAGDGLVARRAAAGLAPGARPARGHGPAGGRRVGVVRRRPGPLRQLAELFDAFDRLSIRDFALVRQSRWREAIADGLRRSRSSCPSSRPCAGSRSPTRLTTRRARRVDQHRQAAVPRRVAGVAARDPGRSRWRRSSRGGARRRAARLRPGEKPPLHRGLAGRLARVGPAEVAVVIRPLASPMPAGHDAARGDPRRAAGIRAPRGRHRRGRERPRPHLARRHRDDGPHVQGAAPDDVDLLGEALEVGGRDPLSVDTIRMAAAARPGRAQTDASSGAGMPSCPGWILQAGEVGGRRRRT